MATATRTPPEPTRTPEQAVAWEAEHKLPAASAAAVAGALTIAGAVITQVALRNFPQVGLLQALTPALNGQARSANPRLDPHFRAIQFLDSHAGQLIVSSVLGALASAAMAYVLLYLYEAVKARRPEFPPAVRIAAIAAPLAVAVLTIARQIISITATHSYLAHPHPEDWRDVIGGGAAAPLGYLGLAAQLAVCVALVMLSINAMRTGLLTRFMGVLGVISGVLFFLPIIQFPVVQALWLLALAPLFAQRWPAGQPPAWLTGRAEPWPTQQQIREQREATRNRAEAQAIKHAPAASDGPVAPGPDGNEPVAPARVRANRRKRRKR